MRRCRNDKFATAVTCIDGGAREDRSATDATTDP